MEIVWNKQAPISVRNVTSHLQGKREIAYTTVMTVMGRLFQKGLLARYLSGLSYFYEPKLTKQAFLAACAHRIFKTAISTLGEEIVVHFVKELKKINPDKQKELLKLLIRSKK